MEVLLMVIVLHALGLNQGHQGAAISSNENGTDVSRSDELGEKQSTGGSLDTASISEDCSGSLLALRRGSWVAVTLIQQSNETKKDMSQLCKDLGCGGPFAENGTMSINICLSDCTIINSNLYNCTEARRDNCSNVVEVICAWQVVQLVGGSDRCAGRVELFGTEGWGSVCDDGWDLRGGNVVCAQLGCGTAVRVTGEAGDFEAGSGPIHISELNCSGTESNLWQCATETDKGENYCGHKEDASVVCSGSSYIPVTTINTFMPDATNWTSENVTEVAAEGTSGGISHPVLGCIVLSVALLLVLLLNAAQCIYYKRRNGGPEARRASQASQRDNSDTSSDSDYEIHNPDLPPITVNHFTHTHTLDSESTSSGECYEKTEMENLLYPAFNQFHPEYCKQMTPLHNTTETAKNASAVSFDSDSTSSGECYENTGVNAEPWLQTLQRDPAVPEPSPSPLFQVAENIPNQALPPDSQSTSSEECYENTKPETENCLNPVEGVPALPEQPPLCHLIPQLVENVYSPDIDGNSTSSEDPSEKVPETEEKDFARSERSVHSSSDSDYDDVSNW